MTRAVLATGAQSQGAGSGSVGRTFAAGTKGDATPLHPGDDGGLHVFETLSGERVIVPRASLRLDGEREAPSQPAAPSPAGPRWRQWDELQEVERPSLAASALRGWLL